MTYRFNVPELSRGQANPEAMDYIFQRSVKSQIASQLPKAKVETDIYNGTLNVKVTIKDTTWVEHVPNIYREIIANDPSKEIADMVVKHFKSWVFKRAERTYF